MHYGKKCEAKCELAMLDCESNEICLVFNVRIAINTLCKAQRLFARRVEFKSARIFEFDKLRWRGFGVGGVVNFFEVSLRS